MLMTNAQLFSSVLHFDSTKNNNNHIVDHKMIEHLFLNILYFCLYFIVFFLFWKYIFFLVQLVWIVVSQFFADFCLLFRRKRKEKNLEISLSRMKDSGFSLETKKKNTCISNTSILLVAIEQLYLTVSHFNWIFLKKYFDSICFIELFLFGGVDILIQNLISKS